MSPPGDMQLLPTMGSAMQAMSSFWVLFKSLVGGCNEDGKMAFMVDDLIKSCLRQRLFKDLYRSHWNLFSFLETVLM